MIDRLSIRYNILDPYTRNDFSDIIALLMQATKPRVSDGRIELRLICKSQEVQRFGKTFFVSLLASGDQIIVKINQKK
jgi:hypothetical protein